MVLVSGACVIGNL